MTSITSSPIGEKTIELAPSYKIPLVLISIAIPLLLVQPWASLPLALFGLFLLLQTVTIRLQFTPTALDIYRSSKLLRRFPYTEWTNWRIFWSPVPILFYFREVNSIHFLPIIFDPKTLKTCLEESPIKSNSTSDNS
ncbi:DUF3119 family protein [Crocosphaera sp. XPORK-15E]|uniref:DUF3119 family protein n=1 Tax=Crocosphaera sp. XPORK-15E TaxID=3110247 RepID=UPI002B221849|nr:DUF3119 family protein [Crocosphaera sp. XPORK-15E]MEA5535764.1 DUF3119 family protein [Crocosphaera sp. XPORK-15E]